MKKDLYFDIKFLCTTIFICIALNVLLRKKTLDGFIDFNINLKITEHNTNEKLDLDQIAVIGKNSIEVTDNDLVNWASWDPHDRKKHVVQPAGSYSQETNNKKE